MMGDLECYSCFSCRGRVAVGLTVSCFFCSVGDMFGMGCSPGFFPVLYVRVRSLFSRFLIVRVVIVGVLPLLLGIRFDLDPHQSSRLHSLIVALLPKTSAGTQDARPLCSGERDKSRRQLVGQGRAQFGVDVQEVEVGYQESVELG